MVDGCLYPADAPVLRVDDRGFLYGDGLFETLRIVDGRVVHLDRHLARLDAGLGALGIERPAPGRIAAEIEAVVAVNGLLGGEGAARVTISRGVGGAGPRPGVGRPTVVVTGRRLAAGVIERRQGMRLRLVPGPWRALAHHKTLCYLPSVLALGAVEADEEPVLLDGEAVLEGATCNVFACMGGTLYTPPADGRLLPGVARAVLLERGAAAGIAVVEAPLDRAALWAAEAVVVTSALLPVAPVMAIDGVTRSGPPAALMQRLRAVLDPVKSSGGEGAVDGDEHRRSGT